MVNKEKSVRPVVHMESLQEPQEPEQGPSGVVSQQGSIN